jgi:ATP-dependent Lon protease
MSEKNCIIKKDINNKSNDVLVLIDKKIEFFKDIIQKTIIHVQKNKFLDILGISDVNSCIEHLGEVSKKIQEVSNKKSNNENLINNLQIINNELSSILKNYGTDKLEDLLFICFGNNYKITNSEKEEEKFELLKKYFHPISYKVLNKKEDSKKKSNELIDEKENLYCSDVNTIYKQFHMKVYGIKLFIYNYTLKKNLVIYGIVDDIIIDFLNNKFICNKKEKLQKHKPNDADFQNENFEKFVSSLILKDFFIFDSEEEIFCKYAGYLCQNVNLKQKQISQIVKDFIADEMYNKRNTLIFLLIFSSNYENQYISYLLYDLLSNDNNGSVDTQEQTILFDSFPWSIKQFFKQAMKKTIQYTNDLSNFDINRIPLEQQICLLKSSELVKEKAMLKLKEVKAKSEDSGTKARQYLDGLLKIPFNIYKREPILQLMEKIRNQFKEIYKKFNLEKIFKDIPFKETYTNVEILKYINKIKYDFSLENNDKKLEKVLINITSGDKKKIIENIILLIEISNQFNDCFEKIKYATLSKEKLKQEVKKIIDLLKTHKNNDLLNKIFDSFLINPLLTNINIKNDLSIISENLHQITDYINNVKDTLDKSVFGHDKAKKQIERIIGQWINGDMNSNTSHILGFEGNPGIGKTTLAKGLASCLKDENGISRPFSLIALGGDSNASTLLGHSYTYVGSNYGSIVQILIDSKCMNPIILFDEVDKISKTEHGREITGVLTHLLDTTQNNCFQDKYFSGIDLDLSKALFILSYNDVESIDKILLDRIHRIKFDSLSIEDKIIISKKHLLPELYKQIGLEDMIIFEDDVLKFIIEEYTLEPGVRKLKEKLFEIVGDINLEILKNNISENKFPLKITICDVKNKYFKDKRELIIRKVPEISIIGYANGMYATTNSIGGVLPIHAKFFPSENFLELKLTGLQQDIMKESMHISLTLAWNLTSEKRKKEIRKLYDGEKNKYGINIHPGDASILKDGPSAGVTITCVIYSLLNNIPIKPKFGLTSEIQLDGSLTAIGGLNYKILGSIKCGVKEFIYPKENKKDFDDFYDKYKNSEILKDIIFHELSNINEVLDLILEK